MKNLFARKKRVLVLGDYNAVTGFSNVLENIMKQLRSYKKFSETVHYDLIAINWYGDRLPDDYEIGKSEAIDIKEVEELIDGQVKKVKKRIRKVDKEVAIHSAYHTDGRDDLFGRNVFLSMLKHIDYDLVFMIQDLGIICPILEVVKKIKQERIELKKRQFKIIYYFPIDGNVIPSWFDNFDVIDRPIAYTEYARAEAMNVRPIKNLGCIYHGIDTNTFSPLMPDEKREFRKVFFGDNADKHIITNINRNQTRKDIPCTVFAFKEVMETIPNSFLYLHMNPDDPQGWKLRAVMEQTGLVNNIDYMFTSPEHIENPPDAGFLNCIYNASDVYLTTTTGEGFGLTILEAMAAGIPVVAPYHTSIMELSGNGKTDRIKSLYEFRPYVSTFDNIVRMQVDYREAAEAVIDILKNDSHRTRFGMMTNARVFAEKLSWDEIGNKWIEEFKQLL